MPKVTQTGNDILNENEYEPIETFTNTTDYKYLQSFLEGLNLAGDFNDADSC